MSLFLLSIVTGIYLCVGVLRARDGQYAEAAIFAGYTLANIGLMARMD